MHSESTNSGYDVRSSSDVLFRREQDVEEDEEDDDSDDEEEDNEVEGYDGYSE
jgi:hypothetical protein